MEENNHNIRNSFTTPEGYFERLNREIKASTCNKPDKKGSRFLVLPKAAGIIGYAAMFAVASFIIAHMLIGDIANGTDDLYGAATATYDFNDSDFIDNMLASYPIDEYTFYSYLTEDK